MKPITVRLIAVGLGVVHAAMSLTATQWTPRGYWRLLVCLLAYLAVAGIYALLTRRVPRGERLVIRPGKFVSEVTVRNHGMVVLSAIGVATLVIAPQWPMNPPAVYLVWPLSLAALLIRQPRLEFSPRSLRLKNYVRWDGFRWDKLASEVAHTPGRVWVRSPADRWWTELDVSGVAAEPAFLAAVISRYVQHPESRERIGDPHELAELLGAADDKSASV